jgi:hypothetical protein
MDEMAALTQRLEDITLKKIIDDLKNGTMTVPEARKNASDFLKIEPFTTPEETYIIIMDFVKSHEVFIELKNYMNAYQSEKNERIKINKMREHLKQNNIEAALAVAKE